MLNLRIFQDMAWGTKYIKFSSGDKVKVGNSVLEAVKSAIIRDYKKATSKSNQEGDPENRIRIFSKNTYLKWLRVISMINHTRWILLLFLYSGCPMDQKCSTGRIR